MLSLLDDYCIHQSADPIRQPATSDENAYDRYFTNGFHREGDYYFAFALGRYPNRSVMDAAITFLVGDTHHSFFASRRDPDEPSEMKLDALELSIDSPMRVMTIRLGKNDSGISCQLRWRARSAPLEEERTTIRSGGRLTNDSTRWTQFGCWEGWFEIDGVRTEVHPELCPGVKDRSWGLRILGDSSGGNFRATPRLFWNWLPLNFGTFCAHSLRFEDTASGRTINQQSVIAPLYEAETQVPIREPDLEHIDYWTHEYRVERESRRIVGGEIHLGDSGDPSNSRKIEIGPPLLTAWTYAIGYGHPKWNHGSWHGDLATGHERWSVDEFDPAEERYAIMHQVVNVSLNGQKGFGFVEQCILGPYPRYGLDT
jgi:hypothetical protein